MANVAGKSRALVKMSGSVKDPSLARMIRALEDKIQELDNRVQDLEKRAAAGGI